MAEIIFGQTAVIGLANRPKLGRCLVQIRGLVFLAIAFVGARLGDIRQMKRRLGIDLLQGPKGIFAPVGARF